MLPFPLRQFCRPRNRPLTQALRPEGRVPAKAAVVTDPGPIYNTQPGAVDGAPYCMDRQAVPTLGPPSSGSLSKLPLGLASKSVRVRTCMNPPSQACLSA